MTNSNHYSQLDPEKTESLWKQYHILVDLYKSYLTLCISGYTFLYAITGGVLTYILKEINGHPLFIFGIPALAAIHFVISMISFFTVLNLVNELKESIYKIGDMLNIILNPHISVLKSLVRIIGGFCCLAVSLGLVVLFFYLKA